MSSIIRSAGAWQPVNSAIYCASIVALKSRCAYAEGEGKSALNAAKENPWASVIDVRWVSIGKKKDGASATSTTPTSDDDDASASSHKPSTIQARSVSSRLWGALGYNQDTASQTKEAGASSTARQPSLESNGKSR